MPFLWRNTSTPTMSKAEQKTKLEAKLLNAKQTPEPIFDLTECGLKEVPSGVYSWCKVCLKESLLLQDNQLVSLEGGGNLKDLALLKVLDVRNNMLINLPEGIGSLSSLQVVYLSNNQIKSLPKSFGLLENLQTLIVSGNKLREFPEVLCGLKRLRTLDISNNRITKLLPSFAHVRTLDTLILDNNSMQYPDAETCAEGTESVMRFLCEECQIEFIPPSQAISMLTDVTDGSSRTDYSSYELDNQDYWKQLENKKEQKRQERLAVERTILEQQTNQATVVANMHLQRLQLLDDVSKNQNKLQEELFQAQLKKDKDKQNLLLELVRVEEESRKCIAHLLEMIERSGNSEAILEREKLEREEFEMLFLKNQEEAQDLRRKEVLDAMMISLCEQDRFKSHGFHREEMVQRMQLETDAETSSIKNVLSRKSQVQEQLVSQVQSEEQLQKEALISLMNKKDSEFIIIRDQVSLIQDELAKLTLLEMKQRDLKLEFELETLEQKREILSQLLVQLLEQQKVRREEMVRRLEEMEAQRIADEQDYWLHQYQRLMDHKPDSLSSLEAEMDPAVRDLLDKAGVQEYIPLFAKRHISFIGLCALGRDGIRELGVHNRTALAAILAALEAVQQEQRRAHEKLTETEEAAEEPSTELEPSAPSDSNPLEMTAHLEVECVVCMERKCCLLFLNCGHVCCCETCGHEMTTCPMCRGDIVHTILLRFSD